MTAVAQRYEMLGQGRAIRGLRTATRLTLDVILALVLLPATLAVGILVVLDAGFPLLVCVRSYDGAASRHTVRFRTTRIDLAQEPQQRCVRSSLGDILHRTRLADLPNVYARLFKI